MLENHRGVHPPWEPYPRVPPLSPHPLTTPSNQMVRSSSHPAAGTPLTKKGDRVPTKVTNLVRPERLSQPTLVGLPHPGFQIHGQYWKSELPPTG